MHFGDWGAGLRGEAADNDVCGHVAMAFKPRGEQRAWFGDGSTSRGDFHEAMNWAGVQRGRRLVFVLENNQVRVS